MLNLNEGMQFIRCSRNEYLVKKGSISNYSFHIKDEEKLGILETLFERISFPIPQEQLAGELINNIGQTNEEYVLDLLEQLLEIDVLIESTAVTQTEKSICVLTDWEHVSEVKDTFEKDHYSVHILVLDESNHDEQFIHIHDDKAASEKLRSYEYVILFKNHFSPGTFYQVNKLCLEQNKKLIISYLDGNEGIIIPLLNFDQVGCYNDFEILRESSFYNLLDYQVMKERLLQQDKIQHSSRPLHFHMLVNQTILLLNHYTRFSSMNYFAYSLDFERMVNTKTRLLKFPKCPSCQSDKNLVHAFI
ncbi:hypothetical protein CJ195_18860 [Bacillus sp. UMB0899]|uniref:hypothetical protein n=1 Tax=Metabacillus schmidteae TaxID=2730405 RepID=UPI000C805D5E|nr:hypothetical protein [Metabacillus schmidteae]PMC35470.1 hypothetical protein CJ195_18860 [Bacillus sp. UMB0899]